MHHRSVHLQSIIGSLRVAVLQGDKPLARRAAEICFNRLDETSGVANIMSAVRLPVCRYLDEAYANMAGAASPLPAIATAFAAIEGQLHWARRKGSTPDNQPFYDGHANAMLIGPGGLEERDDVMVGVSLMAPDILYPDHSHPPEEVYVAFTGGGWWNAGMDWTEPGPGGLIYNPPGILHAMRSGPEPFLAVWLLPLG
jgi:quercetin dioxygenase-like cupin family protein